MKKRNFRKNGIWAVILTGVLIVIGGIGVLVNASRLGNIFDPADYERFENPAEMGTNYDSIAGDGAESDLADEDENGENRSDEERQQEIEMQEPLLTNMEYQPQPDEDSLGLAADSSASEQQDGPTNPGAYGLTENGSGGLGVDRSGGKSGSAGSGNKESSGSSGSGKGQNGSGKNPQGNQKPQSDKKPKPTNTPAVKPTGTPAPTPSVKPTPTPEWENQLKPDAPVVTEDGELVALRAAVPEKWTFFAGDAFRPSEVTVWAEFVKDGKTSRKELSYGGSDGYSVRMSTKTTGEKTAVFSYMGKTVSAKYKVISSYLSVRYHLQGNYTAVFPGPLSAEEKDSAALTKLGGMSQVYAGKGGYADMSEYHRRLIAYLGDAEVQKNFLKDTATYHLTWFLEERDGYLTRMLSGFRYLLSYEFQDEKSYIYYPMRDWGDYSGHSVVDMMTDVPSGYRIRREVNEGKSLLDYMGDQVLVGCSVSGSALSVPEGVTKVTLSEMSENRSVRSLTLPESVREADAQNLGRALPNLTEYVLSGHSNYMVMDGVLYSGDGSVLLAVPAGKTTIQRWPETLTTIGTGAFSGSRIEELTLPNTVTEFRKGCFAGYDGDIVRIAGTKAPKIDGNLEYSGKILVPDTAHDSLYRSWMFALGEEQGTLHVGAMDSAGAEIAEKTDLYQYAAKQHVLVYREEPGKLAAVPSDSSGRYCVPEEFSSVGAYAFADCKGLYAIEFADVPLRLEKGSLALPDGVRMVTFCGGKTEIDPLLFGDPKEGGKVPGIEVYVPESVYESYRKSWTDTLDKIYGKGTAEKLLKSSDNTLFEEDNARYQVISGEGSKARYRLLRVYDFEGTSFKVKEGTSEIAAGAFENCSSLEIVWLPETLKKAGKGAFAGCTSLQTVACNCSGQGVISASVLGKGPEKAAVYERGDKFTEFLYEDDSRAVYGKNTSGGYTLIDVPTDDSGVFALRKNTQRLNQAAFRDCGKLEGIAPKDGKLREIGASCFENCSGLTGKLSFLECDSLTKIGNDAFRGCSALESVELPESVEALGKGIFYGCEELCDFTGTGVRTIGESCFYGCQSLDGVDLAKITKIGANAFAQCLAFDSFGNPENLVSLGQQAFAGCASLSELTLPATLKTMGEGCFQECSALPELTMNSQLEVISRYCFLGCRNLKNVYFKDAQRKKLKAIGVQAFAQCASLSILNLEDASSLEQIGERAFEGCSSLTIIMLPASLKKLPDYGFSECEHLVLVELSAQVPPEMGNRLFGASLSESVRIWVPDGCIQDYRNAYTKILNDTYGAHAADSVLGVLNESNVNIEGVIYGANEQGERVLLKGIPEEISGERQVLEDTVLIADDAFAGCTGLTGITLPVGSSICLGNRCFGGCRNLTTVELYGSIPVWGEDTFAGCTAISRLAFGKGNSMEQIPRIGTRAFKNCTGLAGVSAISIRTAISVFGEECFAGCTKLGGISWTTEAIQALEVLEDRAFENCSAMSVSINSSFTGLRSIGAYTFSNCDRLTNPSVPAAVTVLGEGCYSECDNIATVSIYGGIEEYPKNCFKNCPKLTRTGGTAAAFAALRRIGESAYEGCVSLNSSTDTSWYLSRYENLEEIGDYAFRNCRGLNRDVTLSATLTKLGRGAFDGCSQLSEIILNSVTPPEIGTMRFDTLPYDFMIRVPDSREDGDSVYRAYLESFGSVLGSSQAYKILDSVTDGAKGRSRVSSAAEIPQKIEIDEVPEKIPEAECETAKPEETSGAESEAAKPEETSGMESEAAKPEETSGAESMISDASPAQDEEYLSGEETDPVMDSGTVGGSETLEMGGMMP